MDAIKAVLESWQRAVVEENLNHIMSHYSDDVVAFDAIKALQFIGKADYTEHWKYCMEQCPGGIVLEIHELTVQSTGDLAFCHYLTRCGSVQDFGKEQASWMRATVCLRLQHEQWKIVHEHFSAPFDPETSKAIFDAQPGMALTAASSDAESSPAQALENTPEPHTLCSYLNFNGDCEEALNVYAQLLGGHIDMTMPFEGTPAEAQVPADWRNKIMHAQLSFGPWLLMACDAPPGMYNKPQGSHLQVTVNSADEAERIFNTLAESGTVEMNLEPTFWAERFGMVVDRFGTPWMVNFTGNACAGGTEGAS